MLKRKKRRTRQHVIADLSANHIEYFTLQCGYSVERIEADYGYDLQIYSYDEHGELENGVVYVRFAHRRLRLTVQLKATDHIKRYTREEGFSYALEKVHLDIWLNEPMPVIVILFDAQNEVAYWVYLQAYFEQKGVSLPATQKTFTIYFDQHNIVSIDAVKKWQTYKNHVLAQINGRITHYA